MQFYFFFTSVEIKIWCGMLKYMREWMWNNFFIGLTYTQYFFLFSFKKKNVILIFWFKNGQLFIYNKNLCFSKYYKIFLAISKTLCNWYGYSKLYCSWSFKERCLAHGFTCIPPRSMTIKTLSCYCWTRIIKFSISKNKIKYIFSRNTTQWFGIF